MHSSSCLESCPLTTAQTNKRSKTAPGNGSARLFIIPTSTKQPKETFPRSRRMTLTIQEIMDFLPHRYPFLLIDRVLEFESQKRIVALKNVTINEPFFPG